MACASAGVGVACRMAVQQHVCGTGQSGARAVLLQWLVDGGGCAAVLPQHGNVWYPATLWHQLLQHVGVGGQLRKLGA